MESYVLLWCPQADRKGILTPGPLGCSGRVQAWQGRPGLGTWWYRGVSEGGDSQISGGPGDAADTVRCQSASSAWLRLRLPLPIRFWIPAAPVVARAATTDRSSVASSPARPALPGPTRRARPRARGHAPSPAPHPGELGGALSHAPTQKPRPGALKVAIGCQLNAPPTSAGHAHSSSFPALRPWPEGLRVRARLV
jgi:hypothetical protein